MILLGAVLAAPGEAVGEQPMDRLQRLIDQGKGTDAVEIARKWLAKNEGDRRTEAVLALVDEGTWQVLSEEPDLQGLVDYRADFPQSPHHEAAHELEASLAYYAALKAGTEAAFLEVVDNYAGTKAVPDALEKAAEAGFTEVQGENPRCLPPGPR